jgi:hypothetical protein
MGSDAASLSLPNLTGAEIRRASGQIEAVRADRGHQLVQLQLDEIITKIRRRACAHTLDRGLSISLPYYDDQALELRWWEIQIIPPGRVMFLPAFVVLAVEREREQILGEKRLTPSMRDNLLASLQALERAFQPPPAPPGERSPRD